MEAIEIKARFDTEGGIEPLAIRWQGHEHPVDAIGRRWEAEDGLHFLIMIPSGRAFELRFAPLEARWYLVKVQPLEGTA